MDGDRWGPLGGQLIHFSYGNCSHLLVLRQTVGAVTQGAAVPLPGEFRSGAQRGRLNPADGQLYVSGTRGWGTYAAEDGCFQRVRYTGQPVQLPLSFEARANGLLLTFSQPLDKALFENARSYFAQQWNYRYSAAYGSPELSLNEPGKTGHDVLTITSAHLVEERTLFLEIPQLTPVHELHLHFGKLPLLAHDLYATLHALGPPFTGYPGYQAVPKLAAPAAAALEPLPVRNPWTQPLPDASETAQSIRIEARQGFAFNPRTLTVVRSSRLALTLANEDVIPHNFALLQPGRTAQVGQAADHFPADPRALSLQYIPPVPGILVHTDLVDPAGQQTIYFNAPAEPGNYPFLCTFPGHWQLMQGIMTVE